MWWPSFCAVIVDLWHFAWGTSTVSHPNSEPVPFRRSSGDPQVSERPISPAPVLQLVPEVRYTADHAVTEAIRLYLTEETTLKLTTGDLTPYEWLAYLYTKAGRPLPWLALALAPLGYWHQALKGLSYVSIGLIPKTQALMEWHDDVQHGHVGYVSKVSPEETISVQELGSVLPGVLTETTYTKEAWKELRPVFISVS